MVAADSSRSPATNGTARAPYSDRGYSMEEAVIVDKAKSTHKETTASAQRAAKVKRLLLLSAVCSCTNSGRACWQAAASKILTLMCADSGADSGDCCQYS